ncbi:MAG: GvpL/GvpF family gas vesicle protein [Blastocatellia bacterium]
MNLYAYCLSDEATPDLLDGAAGVAGARPRLFAHESIKAVVSDFQGERARVTRENIFAHESIIHRVLASTTPLPFRFGMVVSAARLESYLASNEAAVSSQLSAVRDTVEMSVKIIWDAEAVRRAAGHEGGGGAAGDAGGRPEMMGPGTAFLAGRRCEVTGDETLRREAGEIARWLERQLSGTLRESSARICPTRAMALAAAHLVERARIEDYRARLARAREGRADLRFLTSGPWPPYSFCELSS